MLGNSLQEEKNKLNNLQKYTKPVIFFSNICVYTTQSNVPAVLGTAFPNSPITTRPETINNKINIKNTIWKKKKSIIQRQNKDDLQEIFFLLNIISTSWFSIDLDVKVDFVSHFLEIFIGLLCLQQISSITNTNSESTFVSIRRPSLARNGKSIGSEGLTWMRARVPRRNKVHRRNDAVLAISFFLLAMSVSHSQLRLQIRYSSTIPVHRLKKEEIFSFLFIYLFLTYSCFVYVANTEMTHGLYCCTWANLNNGP